MPWLQERRGICCTLVLAVEVDSNTAGRIVWRRRHGGESVECGVWSVECECECVDSFVLLEKEIDKKEMCGVVWSASVSVCAVHYFLR